VASCYLLIVEFRLFVLQNSFLAVYWNRYRLHLDQLEKSVEDVLVLYQRIQVEVRQQWQQKSCTTHLNGSSVVSRTVEACTACSDTEPLADSPDEIIDVLSATVQRHKHSQQLSGAKEALAEHVRWVRTLDDRGRIARKGVHTCGLLADDAVQPIFVAGDNVRQQTACA
jgi:hypothetical protein